MDGIDQWANLILPPKVIQNSSHVKRQDTSGLYAEFVGLRCPAQAENSEKPKDGLELGIYLSYVKSELDSESACSLLVSVVS